MIQNSNGIKAINLNLYQIQNLITQGNNHSSIKIIDKKQIYFHFT